MTRELVSVANTTVVNALAMREPLGKVAAKGLKAPVTLVLDNARYQERPLARGAAKGLGIALLYPPGYSPNLNLIERLWRFIKTEALYGRCHPTSADFKAAVEQTIADLPGKHEEALTSPLTLNFQTFEEASLLAA